MKIYEAILNMIIMRSPLVPPETGGILGGKDDIITCYCADDRCDAVNGAVYVPDTAMLNQTITQWEQEGIVLYGLYHTHFSNGLTLSNGDQMYIEKIMSSLPKRIHHLYFPIVLPREQMVAYRAGYVEGIIRITREEIEIIKGR